MRKLLNILYILDENVYLKLDGLNVLATKQGKEVARVPFCNLEGIVCFNYMGCTPALMAKCAEEGVSLNFISPQGRFLAHVRGEIRGNVHLRRAQFRKLEDEENCLNLAKLSIGAKITNSKNYLQKQLRENNSLIAYLSTAIESMEGNLKDLQTVANSDSLRGIEGDAARSYFGVFGRLILNPDYQFSSRNKRPPLDAVNAMLSYLYALLAIECEAALEAVGLDPFMGYLHTDRAGRPALALDLMEEFRCYIVDRLVLNIINLRKISAKEFVFENGGMQMTDTAKKIILKEWQTRKKETIKHPIINEKIEFGLFPYVQARLLAKFLRGEMENYTPFLAKL